MCRLRNLLRRLTHPRSQLQTKGLGQLHDFMQLGMNLLFRGAADGVAGRPRSRFEVRIERPKPIDQLTGRSGLAKQRLRPLHIPLAQTEIGSSKKVEMGTRLKQLS